MAWTQSDIDNLKAAMAEGVLTARTGERSVTYQSLSEMAKQLERMEDDVAKSNGVKVSRRTVASFSNGLR